MTGGRLRAVLPWLVGLALLAILFLRVPWAEFRDAVASGPVLALALFVAALNAATLTADGWATAVSLAATGIRRPIREILLARGATYLPGQLNYALGQAVMGLYLHRAGVDGRRAASGILFVLAGNAVALILAALAAWPLPGGRWIGWAALAAAVFGGWALLGPLARIERLRPLVEPWLEAGPAGALRALGARLVHLGVLFVGMWAAMRLWGVAVPIDPGLGRVPVLFLVAALPISPGGLGTVQAALVLLFRDFAPGASVAARESAVLAFGVVFHVLGVAVQCLLGALCYLALRRRGGRQPAITGSKPGRGRARVDPAAPGE